MVRMIGSKSKSRSMSKSERLKQLLKNSHPVPVQDFFNVLVAETALDQSASQISRMGVVAQIGNKMRSCKFCSQLSFRWLRPLPVNELKEIEANTYPINANQVCDVLDVIDVAIKRAFLFFWAHQHGINSDHAAPFADHLNLLVSYVALDIIIFPRVRV